MEASVVEPVDVFEGGEFDVAGAAPGHAAVGEFPFVGPVEGLGHCIVVAVAARADRGDGVVGGEAAGVADRQVLGAAVCVVDEADEVGAGALAVEDRRLQRIDREVRSRRSCRLPTNDERGEGVDDERCVHPAAVRLNVGEISEPEPVRPNRGEVPLHEVG